MQLLYASQVLVYTNVNICENVDQTHNHTDYRLYSVHFQQKINLLKHKLAIENAGDCFFDHGNVFLEIAVIHRTIVSSNWVVMTFPCSQ